MEKKAGFFIGMGVGYILGTKAGRERYEQIMRSTHRVTEHPKMQRVRENARTRTTGAMRGAKGRMHHNKQDEIPLAPNLKRVDR